MWRDVIKQFFSKTYSGIRELISQQSEQIMAMRGKAPKVSKEKGSLSHPLCCPWRTCPVPGQTTETLTLGQKVLLVGGLGASPYLHFILNEQYENVLQPRKA